MAFPGSPGDVYSETVQMFTLLQAAVAVCLFAAAPGAPNNCDRLVEGNTLGKVAATYLGGLPGEVRLRKLHLVRPDLIPYPIAFEAYC